MSGEWPRVLGFKTEFNDDHTRSEIMFFHVVAVSRKRGGKSHSELITDGIFPSMSKPGI